MIRFDSEVPYIRHCILEYLRGSRVAQLNSRFFTGLQNGTMKYRPPEIAQGYAPWDHCLTFWVPLTHYSHEAEGIFRDFIEGAFRKMHEAEELGEVTVLFRVVPENIPASESGLNNCFFKTERTITHDELRFRSRAEVAIYDELKKRNVLFFPNPAAILGRSEPEQPEKREPDFLICHQGKWGILEVSGEPYHTGAITTAKDHDRARLFQRYGLIFIQHYDSGRCTSNPVDVVDNFLSLLRQAKL